VEADKKCMTGTFISGFDSSES